MKRFGPAALAAIMLWGCASAPAPEPASPNASPLATLSPAERQRVRTAGAQVLFWPEATRSANFRAMETIFPGTIAEHGTARPLPPGKPIAIPEAELTAAMDRFSLAGLMVLKGGRVVLERYRDGLGPTDRWTSFSVAKSFTSTLAGAALKDGSIRSLDDPVTRYLPELAGGGYDGVTVRQLLTMTSGVRWNEDYADPESDVARMLSQPVAAGADPVLAYMAARPREHTPGTTWHYNTGETNLVGLLVARATGRRLSDYAREVIVRPAGFAGDLFWQVDEAGRNVGGCCLSLRLSDYARFGQFVLEGGQGQVSDGWFADAGSAHAQTGRPGFGYGYQWWTYPGGSFGARGIFGQSVTIVPDERLVIAMVGNTPRAVMPELAGAQHAFIQRLMTAAE